jgi:hypothetical protein
MRLSSAFSIFLNFFSGRGKTVLQKGKKCGILRKRKGKQGVFCHEKGIFSAFGGCNDFPLRAFRLCGGGREDHREADL